MDTRGKIRWSSWLGLLGLLAILLGHGLQYLYRNQVETEYANNLGSHSEMSQVTVAVKNYHLRLSNFSRLSWGYVIGVGFMCSAWWLRSSALLDLDDRLNGAEE